MIVAHQRDVLGTRMSSADAENVLKKVLISPNEGWGGYVMRSFEIGPYGHTPKHQHAWPHINYILGGKGILHLDGKDYPVEAGSFAYVPGDQIHQFQNISSEPFAFICIVPEEGDK
ncbi:cupin domain-containing protein [Desulfitobacterium metallireducens]|uniref:Cupin n=1 Tax=Desulfitobacterium metallireducens DSM 15288 TaxID=871968 RepID=W0E8Q7_9FIRM|nr:cupin domain-containing protein [Desulfitobacterium metallireducens]AHF07220.1 cupin [Desulfitobacterium metallireducens DSM 15288]